MEIYINECSLVGQYYSEAEFADAVIAFMGIFDKVNEKRLTAYKNSSVLLHKKAILDSVFTSSLEQLKNKSIKEAFRRLVFNRSNPKDWTLEQLHSINDIFTCPILDDIVGDTVLAEVAERKLQSIDEIPRLLVNFKGSSFETQRIDIFKNDEHHEKAISLDCIDNQEDFIVWLSQYEEIETAEHYLNNTNLFNRTKHQVQGKTVYNHIQSGQYWYLDNLHRNHFEIFNSQQQHIGVSDLQGNIDYTKKKKGRTITF